MRTKSSIKNTIAIFISQITNILLGMISTTLFIKFLNIEYRGINGLFHNIISMLSITELGISNAIVVNLYKPIHENNTERIKTLIHFYKKTYNIIILIITIIGLAIIPFLNIIVGPITVDINLTLAYILALLGSISSYTLAYKRSMLYATQKEYILQVIQTIYFIICNILQIISLYLTENYYLYLMIKLLCQIIENLVISLIVNKQYKYLKDKNYTKLDKKTEKSIWKKVGALSIHKLSTAIVNNTDNILISSFLGVISVGLYSNYYLIINNVKILLYGMMASTIAPIGDLLIEKNEEKNYQTFKKIRFINVWLAVFTSVCLLVIMQDFICLWIGKKYLLDNFVLLILILNYYQKILQRPYRNFKDAAGIWLEDKYVPLIIAILNIIFSIILLKIFGLAGVFIGTILSSLVYWLYSFPKYIYKGLFKKNYLNYFLEITSYLLLLFIAAFPTYKLIELFRVSNQLLQVAIDIVISCLIPNLILLIIFHKNKEFKYFRKLILKK